MNETVTNNLYMYIMSLQRFTVYVMILIIACYKQKVQLCLNTLNSIKHLAIIMI